jgi:hypothetical protein
MREIYYFDRMKSCFPYASEEEDEDIKGHYEKIHTE